MVGWYESSVLLVYIQTQAFSLQYLPSAEHMAMARAMLERVMHTGFFMVEASDRLCALRWLMHESGIAPLEGTDLSSNWSALDDVYAERLAKKIAVVSTQLEALKAQRFMDDALEPGVEKYRAEKTTTLEDRLKGLADLNTPRERIAAGGRAGMGTGAEARAHQAAAGTHRGQTSEGSESEAESELSRADRSAALETLSALHKIAALTTADSASHLGEFNPTAAEQLQQEAAAIAELQGSMQSAQISSEQKASPSDVAKEEEYTVMIHGQEQKLSAEALAKRFYSCCDSYHEDFKYAGYPPRGARPSDAAYPGIYSLPTGEAVAQRLSAGGIPSQSLTSEAALWTALVEEAVGADRQSGQAQAAQHSDMTLGLPARAAQPKSANDGESLRLLD